MSPVSRLVQTSTLPRAPGTRGPRRVLTEWLARADVELDGHRPWDPRIRRERGVARILRGTLGAGQAYVDGDWDCDALDVLAARLLSGHLDEFWTRGAPLRTARTIASWMANAQSTARSRPSVLAHYDLGNPFYEAMLGPTMAYSCGYWQTAETLDEAQRAKHQLIAGKIGLEPGMTVLDIGSGWGGFARCAAECFGARVTGVTLSPAQAAYARTYCRGLPVEILELDYRDVVGRFDRIVSIGMFEHVGPRNYRTFFEVAARCLKDDGLLLLHTIGGLRSTRMGDPWIDRFVFPNAVLPSAAQITRAMEGMFVLEDWHNFGADYDRTLMAWHARLERAWDRLPFRGDTRFRRLWRYYLLTCAGSFRARSNQLWQLVLSPAGVPGGYRRPCL